MANTQDRSNWEEAFESLIHAHRIPKEKRSLTRDVIKIYLCPPGGQPVDEKELFQICKDKNTWMDNLKNRFPQASESDLELKLIYMATQVRKHLHQRSQSLPLTAHESSSCQQPQQTHAHESGDSVELMATK